MNVDALRKHLSDLADFMAAAGAGASVVGEVRSVADGLTPFKDYRLPAFTAFLKKAEVYDRTKELPVVGKAVKPKVIPPLGSEITERIIRLYEQAATATDEQIDAAVGLLNMPAVKAVDLFAVAKTLGIEGKLTGRVAKAKMVDEIRRAVRDRRAMFDRTRL